MASGAGGRLLRLLCGRIVLGDASWYYKIHCKPYFPLSNFKL